jgi:hypothetical protein
MTAAPLPPWDDWPAWRRRVTTHGREAVVAWLASAGGAVGPGGYRPPPRVSDPKAWEWLEASLAEHAIPPEARP